MLPTSPVLRDTEQDVYLVRHGETDLNAQGIVQGGGVDSSLNERGRQQAQLLYATYKAVPFVAVYASTLKRTAETLAPFAQAGYAIDRHKGLNEMGWGVLEGVRSDEEVRRIYAEINQRWESGDLDASIEGGESPNEVAARARAALTEILLAHPEGPVLVCAHGRLLRILLTEMMGYPLTEMHHFGHSNTGVNHIRRAGTRFTALKLNDTAHLKAGPA